MRDHVDRKMGTNLKDGKEIEVVGFGDFGQDGFSGMNLKFLSGC